MARKGDREAEVECKWIEPGKGHKIKSRPFVKLAKRAKPHLLKALKRTPNRHVEVILPGRLTESDPQQADIEACIALALVYWLRLVLSSISSISPISRCVKPSMA